MWCTLTFLSMYVLPSRLHFRRTEILMSWNDIDTPSSHFGRPLRMPYFLRFRLYFPQHLHAYATVAPWSYKFFHILSNTTINFGLPLRSCAIKGLETAWLCKLRKLYKSRRERNKNSARCTHVSPDSVTNISFVRSSISIKFWYHYIVSSPKLFQILHS
jgi:hypothetical protein